MKVHIGAISIRIALFFFHCGNQGFVGKWLFGFYKLMMRWLNLSVLPVVNADVYKEKTDNVQITPIVTNRLGVSANIIMAGNEEETRLTEKPIPDLRLKLFKNVCIQGNSDVVVDAQNGFVISEEAYNLDDNLEIIDGLLYRTADNLCILRNNLRHPIENIQAGIMISGKFCNNYYHLMYEHFNKLVYLNSLDIPSDIPLIIDRKTLSIPSCKTIFDILTKGSTRPVVEIDSNKLYLFELLYCLDHVNKLPSHSKDPHKPSIALYSPQALNLLRDSLLSSKSINMPPKKFFISRAGTVRRHFNEDEIYGVLQKYGFERLAPERYSFEEQMAIFNGAEYIVAGSGAALTNLLFVNSNCTVVCFGRSSYNEICEVPIFNTIAVVNGANFCFFPRKNSVNENIHVNYEIDCDDFEKQIKKMFK